MALNSPAITVDNYNALEAALIEGVQKVKYSDKEIEYRSVKEMMLILNYMQKKLGLDKCSGKKGLFGGRRLNAIHSKGL